MQSKFRENSRKTPILKYIAHHKNSCSVGACSCAVLEPAVLLKMILNSDNFPHFWKTRKSIHCVKSAQIRSFFWSVFSSIRTKYGDLRRFIQSEYRKIRTRKTSVFGHFSRSDFFLPEHLTIPFAL